METPTASTRDLAQRLLAVEAAARIATGTRGQEAVLVCEKLQAVLTRFAGSDAYTSLLRRSLALAREECSALQSVTIKSDGSLEGTEAFAVDAAPGGDEAAVVMIAHFLGLLVTFIGETLTQRLVHEAWLGTSLNESPSTIETDR